MKKIVLVILLGIITMAARAEVITEQQAYEMACEFFHHARQPMTRTVALPVSLAWDGSGKQGRLRRGEAPACYVFNRGNRQGFVIVAGENTVDPVLGYSYEGSFDATRLPDALKAWLESVDAKIAALRRTRDGLRSPSAGQQQAPLSWGSPVVRLHTPEWDQEAPYNAYLPSVDGWHGYVGCTMTATAIVMGYHQWPDCGEGSLKGYYTSGLGVNVPGVTLGHPYLWEKMPGINNNGFATEGTPDYAAQEDAVSTLTRDLGVMFKARYDYTRTSADPEVVPLKLVRHMKYHEGIVHLKEENFSEQVWQDLLKEELSQNRPVIFAGYKADGSEGHTIVLEGYDEAGLFAVNWGWSGRYNGFYNLESLRVGHQGPDLVGGGYATQQEAILRIRPQRPGQPVPQVDKMLFTRKAVGGSAAGMGLHLSGAPASFVKGSQFTVAVGAFMNFCTYTVDSNIHLALTDAVGNLKSTLYTSRSKCYLSPGGVTMPFYDERDFITVTLDQEVEEGDRIRLLFRRPDGKLVPVTTLEPDIPWEIVLKEDAPADACIEVRTTEGQRADGRAVATFSAAVPCTPDDATVEAFYAELKDANTVVLKKIEAVGGQLVVPAHTGVVLATQGARIFQMRTAARTPAYVPASNLLRATKAGGTVADPDINAYILAKNSGEVLFHALSGSDRHIAENHAYLVLPSSIPSRSVKMIVDDDVTGIGVNLGRTDTDSPVCDLSGRRVLHLVKGGIYIQNGKKFIFK